MGDVYTIQEKELSPSRAMIILTGRITAVNAGEIKNYLNESIGRGYCELVFNLSGISFLDSSGLAVFVSALKNTRAAGGWLKLAALPEMPGTIFKLTCLDRVIDMYPDVESALLTAE